MDELISRAELFSKNFIHNINNKNESLSKRQVYFLDYQELLREYMTGLLQFMNTVHKDDNLSDDVEFLFNKADSIVQSLKAAVTEFQNELAIDSNISEESTAVQLTEETILEKVNTELDIESLTPPYNYALVYGIGTMELIAAKDNTELNDTINKLITEDNHDNVRLYKLSLTPVELKKKVVFSV